MDRVVDVPVVMARQVPTIRRLQNSEDVPQVQFSDMCIRRILDVTVVKRRREPTVKTSQKTVEVPQSQHLRRVIDAPVAMPEQERVQQSTMEQIIDVPVPPVEEEIVEVLLERMLEFVVEQAIDEPVPSMPEQTVEVVKLEPQERVQRIVEQIATDRIGRGSSVQAVKV